jgi:hypothetical protein
MVEWLNSVASISLPATDGATATTNHAEGGQISEDGLGGRPRVRRIPANAITMNKILCEEVPDDTTLKSNIRIVANFDLTPLLGVTSPIPCEDCVLSDAFARRQREWKVSQVVWCFPPSRDSSFVLEQAIAALSKDAMALGRSGNATMFANIDAMKQLVSTFQMEWQEAMCSVLDLFLDRKVSGFTVSSVPSGLGSAGTASNVDLAASFYLSTASTSPPTSSSSSCSSKNGVNPALEHFCAMSGANSIMLKRLIDMDIEFHILAPPGMSIDEVFGVEPSRPASEHSITSMSSAEMQSALNTVGLSRGAYTIIVSGSKGIRGAVDCIMERSLFNAMDVLKPNEGSTDTIRFGESVALPRIVSSKPFSHATIVECDVAEVNFHSQAVRTAKPPSGEGAVAAAGLEDSVTLRGLFDTACLQRLTALLVACAAAYKHKVISASALNETGRNRSDMDDEEDEFTDRSCFEHATLLASKQATAAPSGLASQIAVIRNPFEFDEEQEVLIPDQVLKESAEDHPDRLYFYITASEPVGVPYHQPVKKKKRKLKSDAIGSAASLPWAGDKVRTFMSKVIYWSNDLLPSEEGGSGKLTNESSQALQEDCSRVVSQTALEVTVEQREPSFLLSQTALVCLHEKLSDAVRSATVLPALKDY